MFAAYLLITVIAKILNLFSATCDFFRSERILVAMRNAGVPESWLTTLGIFTALEAIGLVLGFRYPLPEVQPRLGSCSFHMCGCDSLSREGHFFWARGDIPTPSVRS
jgi:DoxX-like family